MNTKQTIVRFLLTQCLLVTLFFLTSCVEEPVVEESLTEGNARIEATFQLSSPLAMDGNLVIRETYLKLDRVELAGNAGENKTGNVNHSVPADEPPYRLAHADSLLIVFTLPYLTYEQLSLNLFLYQDQYELVFAEDPVAEVPTAEVPSPDAGGGQADKPATTDDQGTGGNGEENGETANNGDPGDANDTGNEEGENEGNASEGDVGEEGVKGENGEDGGTSTGEKGDKGNKGNDGEQGDKGDDGGKGDKDGEGDKGEKGDKEKGDKGDKGKDDKGDKGDKEKGDKGEKGRGDKGEKEKGDKGKSDKGDKGHEGDKEKDDKGHKHDNGEKGDKNKHQEKNKGDHDDDDDGRMEGHTVSLEQFFDNAKPSIAVFGTYQNDGDTIAVLLAVTDVAQLTLQAQKDGETAIQLSENNSAIVSFNPQYLFEILTPSDIEGAALQYYQDRAVLLIHKDFNTALYEKLIPRMEHSFYLNIATDL